jgi:tetratricopeptide (TPR) repeat protein
MDFRKWQEEQRKKKEQENDLLPLERFFGRKDELSQLKTFLENNLQSVFCLYGVPMIGKSTLVREFSKSLENFTTLTIKFNNPENPEVTLEKSLTNLDFHCQTKQLIVIENFEEALLWKGDQKHLHEIRFPKIKGFIEEASRHRNIKLILESRFLIKFDFLPLNIITDLSSKQLGKIDRKELYDALNEIYRHNRVKFEDFEEVCAKLNDHVWLLELAMQNEWLFEDIREAVQNPESITQKLWDKVQIILRKLPIQHRILLCAFGVVNPIKEIDIKTSLGQLPMFSRKNELNNAVLSLRKKLFVIYDSKDQSFELNPFLREVCFTYLQGQKEMEIIENIDFFKRVRRPQYNSILQAHTKGDYFTFYKLIKEKRKNREFDIVIDFLKEVYWTDPKPELILNEIGITYKWQKNYSKAIEIFKDIIQKYKLIPAFTELAIIYKEQKNYSKAIEVLEQALTIDNKDVKTLNVLGRIYKEQGNYSKAIDVFEKALKIEDTHVQTFNELAIIYREQRNYDKAIEILEQVLKIDSNDVKAQNELGMIFKDQGDYSKAIEIFKNLTQKHKHVPAFTELAIIYKNEKSYSKAIEVLEQAIKIDSNDVKAQNVLAMIYKEQGDYPKAIDLLKKSLIIDGKHIHSIHQLAITYRESGDMKQALEVIHAGLKFAPNDKFLNSFLKKSTSQKNKSEKIIKQKILFIAANPSNESRLQTDLEFRIIKAEIRRGTHRDAFEFLQPQLAVTISELVRAMNDRPHIVHFSGHGDKEGIIITTENNESVVLPISAMDRLFKPLIGITKIVILNSCYSAEQAKSISRYGIYVVGNNLPIGDKAAIDFAKGLYNGLSEGKNFETAYNDAQIVLMTESPKYVNVVEVWKDEAKLSL